MNFTKIADKKFVKRYITFAFLIIGLVVYLFIGAISTEWIGQYAKIEIADYIFIIFTLLIVLFANYEILKLNNGKHWPWYVQAMTYILATLMYLMPINPNANALDFPFYSYLNSTWYEEWIISLVYVIITIIYFVLILLSKEITFFKMLSTFLLTLFIVITAKAMTKFMLNPVYGWSTFLWLLIIVVCSDSFAFVGGVLFGKHKLAPNVSPNKTIEGAVFGTIMAMIISIAYAVLMYKFGDNGRLAIHMNSSRHVFGLIDLSSDTVRYVLYVLFGFALSIFSMFGDLTFSAIKRHYGIKDFSNLLPGHGGVLDRLDSISFVFVLMYIIATIMWY